LNRIRRAAKPPTSPRAPQPVAGAGTAGREAKLSASNERVALYVPAARLWVVTVTVPERMISGPFGGAPRPRLLMEGELLKTRLPTASLTLTMKALLAFAEPPSVLETKKSFEKLYENVTAPDEATFRGAVRATAPWPEADESPGVRELSATTERETAGVI